MTTQLISAAVPVITSYVEFDDNGEIFKIINYDKDSTDL